MRSARSRLSAPNSPAATSSGAASFVARKSRATAARCGQVAAAGHHLQCGPSAYARSPRRILSSVSISRSRRSRSAANVQTWRPDRRGRRARLDDDRGRLALALDRAALLEQEGDQVEAELRRVGVDHRVAVLEIGDDEGLVGGGDVEPAGDPPPGQPDLALEDQLPPGEVLPTQSSANWTAARIRASTPNRWPSTNTASI